MGCDTVDLFYQDSRALRVVNKVHARYIFEA